MGGQNISQTADTMLPLGRDQHPRQIHLAVLVLVVFDVLTGIVALARFTDEHGDALFSLAGVS
jgi:hypothetical protein